MPLSRALRVILALALVLGGGATVLWAKSGRSSKEGNSVEKPQRPANEDLRGRLSPLQYEVTQQCGTEPPFQNEYWDNHRDGIYVDVVSGEPLFSSKDKFDSGTGWPSFTQPIAGAEVMEKTDTAHGMRRVEVRSGKGDSHLGHVFDDGPGPKGQRFCINSASLRFIPADQLQAEGYGQYLSLFPNVVVAPGRETAILAGGCFWGVEELIRKLPGVLETTVGYAGGTLDNPTYAHVSSGRTGHAEAVRVVFDPAKLTYADLLRYFFRLHDPTTKDRQGHDTGTQYRSAIFATTEEQRKVAEAVKTEVDKSGKWKAPVVTQIASAPTFYPAEDYHQKYLQKHPDGYTCHFLRD